MGARRVVDLATGRPLLPILSIICVPGSSGTRVNILTGNDLLGSGSRTPVGHLAVRLRGCDLVGLTPAAAALKVVRALEVTLRAIDASQRRAKPPAPPPGVTGASVQVPGQMALFPA